MIPALDLTVWQIFLRATGGLVAIGVFGAALAWMFKLLGDEGPVLDGRGHPSPVLHTGWLAWVGTVIVRFGWAKPLDVDPRLLRGGPLGTAAAVVAAMAVLVALGNLALFLSPYPVRFFPPPFGIGVQNWLTTLAPICALTVLMNLIPLPPFAAGYVLKAYAPRVYNRLPPDWLIGFAVIAAIYMMRPIGAQGLLLQLASLLLSGRL
ncbi:peptidase M50 [Ketogulonicigenium robustum]|uniref:Peptidase M50 n=1 Tax=Ketogulonicigenium robustum TaxID=92947 RepID=A0A1W6P2D7_9RHOB|nr:peptidase M50 [Ketogulonicigenium robustum]ARO15593.1 peptidase M50 [Ketogulonicigenium robustum]